MEDKEEYINEAAGGRKMEYGEIDKSKMTVTMSMLEYEFYRDAVIGRDSFRNMLKRANKDGKAIMTDELKQTIEDIFY